MTQLQTAAQAPIQVQALPGASALGPLRASIAAYLASAQVQRPGTFYGAFWSEKAYHGPLLDFHAGGAHHHRGAGSAALALHLIDRDPHSPRKRQAELGFDWLISRQRPSGGFWEIQNNDRPSDWERTGLEECSTIATAFAVRGLALALLDGLPPKPLYARALRDAGLWLIGQENPPGSGILPHHERSPYDTLNANIHGAEMLMAAYRALKTVYRQPLDIFSQAARRAVEHTLPLQHAEGYFPYRAGQGVTINYTAMVTWCLLNLLELGEDLPWVQQLAWQEPLQRAASFLRRAFSAERGLDWDRYEQSTARHNTHTYLLIHNTLERLGGEAHRRTAGAILEYLLARRTPEGLLPVKDHGEVITHCLPMQADMLLCLLPARARS